jgi:hypothetical protein
VCIVRSCGAKEANSPDAETWETYDEDWTECERHMKTALNEPMEATISVHCAYECVGRVSVLLIFSPLFLAFHVRWVLCHHGTARPQVANGGDGLQMDVSGKYILNKQSRTVDNGWSSSLGVERGANNSSAYKASLLRKVTKGLGSGRILWINNLS